MQSKMPTRYGPFFSKVFFYGILDRETLLVRMRDAVITRQEKLHALQTIRLAPPLGPCREIVDGERVTAAWNLMLDYGRAEVKTQIQWLQDAIEKIENEFQQALCRRGHR
jgi:hypothetical protein